MFVSKSRVSSRPPIRFGLNPLSVARAINPAVGTVLDSTEVKRLERNGSLRKLILGFVFSFLLSAPAIPVGLRFIAESSKGNKTPLEQIEATCESDQAGRLIAQSKQKRLHSDADMVLEYAQCGYLKRYWIRETVVGDSGAVTYRGDALLENGKKVSVELTQAQIQELRETYGILSSNSPLEWWKLDFKLQIGIMAITALIAESIGVGGFLGGRKIYRSLTGKTMPPDQDADQEWNYKHKAGMYLVSRVLTDQLRASKKIPIEQRISSDPLPMKALIEMMPSHVQDGIPPITREVLKGRLAVQLAPIFAERKLYDSNDLPGSMHLLEEVKEKVEFLVTQFYLLTEAQESKLFTPNAAGKIEFDFYQFEKAIAAMGDVEPEANTKSKEATSETPTATQPAQVAAVVTPVLTTEQKKQIKLMADEINAFLNDLLNMANDALKPYSKEQIDLMAEFYQTVGKPDWDLEAKPLLAGQKTIEQLKQQRQDNEALQSKLKKEKKKDKQAGG